MTTIHAKYTEAHSRPSEAYEAQVDARIAARRQAEQEALERQDREDAARFDEAERRQAAKRAARADAGKGELANIVTVVLALADVAATFEANKGTGRVSIKTTENGKATRHQLMTIEEARVEYRRLSDAGYKPR